jgi:hypothetical protein
LAAAVDVHHADHQRGDDVEEAMNGWSISDPVERIIADALEARGIAYRHEQNGLDFYLPEHDLYIEVKRMHSPRIAEQMSRAPNVIAVQGMDAATWLADLIRKRSFTGVTPETAAPRTQAGEG